jgi:hypothetical protein
MWAFMHAAHNIHNNKTVETSAKTTLRFFSICYCPPLAGNLMASAKVRKGILGQDRLTFNCQDETWPEFSTLDVGTHAR